MDKGQKALVIQNFKQKPILKEVQVPKLQDGEILIKLNATTVNPSDRMIIDGLFFKRQLPAVGGLEGTGTVVEANGQEVQHWIGKKVTFMTTKTGTWANYIATTPLLTFQIDEDVPLQSAACGVVNPLTVIGIFQIFKERKLKGLVHCPGASALGRMLNKLCLREGIPLLNIVRKEEQAELLRKEGAESVLVTTGDWQPKYKQYIEKYGFDCLFDALGGGTVTQILAQNLPIKSGIFLYGSITQIPFTFSKTGQILSGKKIEGFLLQVWWKETSQEVKNRVRKAYSSYLKNQLSTPSVKELTFEELEEALQLSIDQTLKGKVLMKPVQ